MKKLLEKLLSKIPFLKKKEDITIDFEPEEDKMGEKVRREVSSNNFSLPNNDKKTNNNNSPNTSTTSFDGLKKKNFLSQSLRKNLIMWHHFKDSSSDGLKDFTRFRNDIAFLHTADTQDPPVIDNYMVNLYYLQIKRVDY